MLSTSEVPVLQENLNNGCMLAKARYLINQMWYYYIDFENLDFYLIAYVSMNKELICFNEQRTNMFR